MKVRTLTSFALLVMAAAGPAIQAGFAQTARDPMRPIGASEVLARRIGTAISIEPSIGGAAGQMDIRAVDASAAAFFDRLAVVSATNVMVQPDVSTRLTLTLHKVTLQETLQAVRELYGLDSRGVGDGFMVLAAKPQTRVFQLNYLDLHRTGVSNTRVSSGQITQANATPSGSAGASTAAAGGGSDELSGTSVMTHNDSDFWKGIEADIKLLVGGDAGSVVVNRQSGVIVVRGMPTQLRDVTTYLQKTQTTVTRQVILEAKIVEVELNSGFQAGINWTSLLTHGGQKYFVGQSSPPGGFGADPFSPTGGQVSVTPGIPVLGQVIDQLGGAFTMAVDAGDFNGFIELLSSQGNTRVLSSPRVSTLHNQKAIIKAGSDEFFVTGVKSDTTTGTSTNTSLNVELTPFFSGVALDVTPQISEDGTVLLHIHPTVSEVSDQSKRVNFGGGTSDLPLALSQIRESDSVVRARSGQLIVIGGLMRETRRRADYRTPLLGDVPVLGRLFRSERDQTKTVELVLLLRPLVPTDGDWEKLAQEPQDRATSMAELGKVDKAK
jgi:MSHA biogenesis protein MshL